MNKNDRFLGKLYDMLVREELLDIIQDEKEVHLTTKVERVNAYFDRLKHVEERAHEQDKIKSLKRMYYNRYIIKEEDIPEGYFKSLEKRYLDEGHGHVNLVNPQTNVEIQLRKQHVDSVINEQKSSLDSWLDYLLSPDANYLEMWAKVWVFQGMLKIGNFDVNKNTYGRRSKVTVNPFVSFDSEVMGKCVDLVKQNLDGGAPTERELDKLVESGNFAKLYGMLLANKKKIKITSNDGIWIKYNYETKEDILRKEQEGIEPEYLKLYNSLQGYNTGWCTAGSKETAKDQVCGLSNYVGGNFYVYYSKDENGEYKIPRIAIRMNRDKIGEIRGIAENQNIESGMEEILEEKLKEFPNADSYKKRMSDMSILTNIYYKHKKGIDLTKEEIKFLYEIDDEISGFGYQKDPRINEIIKTRNKRKDLAFVFDCREEQIGLNEEELSEDLVYYDGSLDFDDLVNAEGLTLPRYIKGSLWLCGLTSAKGLTLPEYIGGTLYLSGLTSAKGLILPKCIKEYLDLSGLTSAKDLVLPEYVGEYLDLRSLTSGKDLILPEHIEYSLDLRSLTSAKELVLPEHIGGYLDLSGLTSLEGLTLPKYIGGDLFLNSLTSGKGLVLPEYIGGTLYLSGLTSAKGLALPNEIGRNIIYKKNYYNLNEFKELQRQEELESISDVSKQHK